MITRFQILVLTTLMCSVAMGWKSARVCLSDGNTPLEFADPCIPWIYRDIMVGTHLTIIVDSNDGGYWEYGELSIWDTNQNCGDLDCMGSNCEDSILPDAGNTALAWEFQEERFWDDVFHDVNGFMFSGDPDANSGDWFIIDYNAISVGSCQVAFFDGDFSWDEPLYEMSFTHVPSRDFNEDGIVNLADFAVFASYWGNNDCTDPDGCGKADFYDDGIIDVNDLGLFVDFWLERTN